MCGQLPASKGEGWGRVPDGGGGYECWVGVRDVGVGGQGMAGSWDVCLRDARVEQDRVLCLQLHWRPVLSKLRLGLDL